MTPHAYALLAQEAYNAAPDIGAADSASRAIVRHTEDGLCIAFPGTNNIASWLADLDALTVEVPRAGSIHEGFWNAWLAIAEPVLTAIGGKPVTLVGHSLGGALAVCAAVSLTIAGKPPAAVYGFEAPRVSPGYGVYNLLAGQAVFLTRNGLDVVTQVPLNWDQSAEAKDIGHPALPIDNVIDHEIARVIEALA